MIKFKNPHVVINSASGSTSDIRENLQEIFRRKFGVDADCHYITPDKLTETLESALNKGADLLVTFGGDGTSLAAASLAGPKDVPIVTLPGGTMNVLPKALYGSDEWAEVLEKALACDSPRWVPAGELNGEMFLVAAIIGTIGRVGVTRELVREGELIAATKNLVKTLQDVSPDNSFSYKLEGAGKSMEANMIQITCPDMTNHSQVAGKFEAASINIDTYTELPALGLTAMFDEWREDKRVESNAAQDITLIGEGKADVLLDGEHRQVPFPLRVRLEPKGAYVLCPPAGKIA